MKRITALLPFTVAAAIGFAGCSGKVDYYEYVSEERTNVYVYEEDGLSLKIHRSNREQPYNSDGYKGEMCSVAEVLLTLDETPGEVDAVVNGHSGQMNYLAVSKSFYLCFTTDENWGERVSVSLTLDGKPKKFDATSVLYDGVITPSQALDCVREYDGELFDGLTENRAFAGEIRIRLLYDDNCYYYVGVVDREGSISAYLVDGENGRIIAKRNMSA